MAKTSEETLNDLKRSLRDIISDADTVKDIFTGIFELLSDFDKEGETASDAIRDINKNLRHTYSELYNIRRFFGEKATRDSINELFKNKGFSSSDLKKEYEFFTSKAEDQQETLLRHLTEGLGISLNQKKSRFRLPMTNREFFGEPFIRQADLNIDENSAPVGLSDFNDSLNEISGLVREQKNRRAAMEEVLEYSDLMTEAQKRFFREQRDDASDMIDELKNSKDIPYRLIRQLRDNSSVAEKAAEERKKIEETLQGISDGTVEATEKDVQDLIERREKLKDYDQKVSEGFGISFLSGVIGNNSFAGGRFSSFAETALKNRNSEIEAEGKKREYQSELTELDTSLKEGELTEEDYEKQKKEIEDNISAVSAATKEVKKANWTKFIQDSFTELLKDLGKKAAEKMTQYWKDAWRILNDIASYSTTNSMLVNSSARQQQLTYGLSASQNYAFTQTKSIMGISSDEDLFWMNDNQKQLFQELMQKETEIYDKMTADGTLESFQKMQVDLAMLKTEFTSEVAKFFADNRETILSFMKGLMEVMKVIMNVTSGILNIIGSTHRSLWGDTGYDSGFSYDVTQSEIDAYKNAGNKTEVLNQNFPTEVKKQVDINITANGSDNDLSHNISDRVKMAIMNFAQS